MVTEPPKTLSRIRTYAQDLENARAKNGESVPVEAAKKVETPKLGMASTTVQEAPPTPTPPSPPRPPAPPTEKALAPKDQPTITQIPAFHELQKKASEQATTLHRQEVREPEKTNIKAPAAPSKRTVSIRTKKTDLKQPRHAGGGAIITDGRKTDFSLFGSLTTSIKNWFSGVGKAFKKKEAPKYTITDTERRKGVIQKATSKTGSIFTADSDTLRDEIRRRQTQRHEDPDITWSPNTEAGYALLESGTPKPITSNVVVEFKKQSTPTPPPVVAPTPRTTVPPPVFVEPTTQVTPETSEEEDVSEFAPLENTSQDEILVQEEIAEGSSVDDAGVTLETVPEEAQAPSEESAADYELTTPEAHYKVRGLGDIGRLNTNTLSLGVVAVIASFLIIIVGVRALIGVIMPDSENVTAEPVTALTKSGVTLSLQLSSVTPEGLEEALAAATLPEGNVVEIRFTDESGAALNSSSALQLFGISTNSLITSVTEAHLVVTPQGRALVLKIKDTTTTFGQLLSSETQLPGNLTRVFATSYSGGGTFYDANISGTDTRVYKTTESDGLTYGFVDSNTVVIAKDMSVFTTVISGQ